MTQILRRAIYASKAFISEALKKNGYAISKITPSNHSLDIFEYIVESFASNCEDFFFIQVGALDGKTADPIRAFIEKYRWKGILIEPQPEIFKILKQNYSSHNQLAFENSAIHGTLKEVTLFTTAVGGDVTVINGMASFDENLIKKQVSLKTSINRIKIPAMNFKELHGKHKFKKVDLLQIDTEGFDYEVIKIFDFHSFLPSVIHYEHRHLTPDDQVACREYLHSFGYEMFTNGPDTIAVFRNNTSN